MQDRTTTCAKITKDTDMTKEYGYSHIYKRLAEWEQLQEDNRIVILPPKNECIGVDIQKAIKNASYICSVINNNTTRITLEALIEKQMREENPNLGYDSFYVERDNCGDSGMCGDNIVFDCDGCKYEIDMPSHQKCDKCARIYDDHYESKQLVKMKVEKIKIVDTSVWKLIQETGKPKELIAKHCFKKETE